MRQALLLLMLCALTPVLAETVYISDVLRVGVRAQPNSSAAPLVVVTSGAELEVLERQRAYLRVRTAEGVEGWISESYATDLPPAQQRLEQAENDRLELQDALAQLRTQRDEIQMDLAQIASELEVAQGKNLQLNKRLEQLESTASGSLWLYYLSGLVLLFVFGFYLGVRWYQSRVAQRLGGLEF